MDEKKALTTFPRIYNSADVVIPSVPRWEDSSLGSASLRTATALTSNLKADQGGGGSSKGVYANGALRVNRKGKVVLSLFADNPMGRSLLPSSSMRTLTDILPPLPRVVSPQMAIHRSSGDLSVSVASQDEAADPQPRLPAKKYALRESMDSLWGGKSDTIEAREEIMRSELQALAEEQERRQQAMLEELEHQRMMAEAQNEAEFANDYARDFDYRRRFQGRGLGSEDSEDSGFVIGLQDSLTRLAASKAREKLRNLAMFINGHTNRKILSCWNMIESRFKQSSVFKVVMVTDSQGLQHPIRHNALTISALARILCSSRVRLSHGELAVLLDRVEIAEKDVRLGLRIAALNVVIQVCAEAGSNQAATYREQMLELLKKEHALVSITELRDVVFSLDPMERLQQEEEIAARKQVEVAAMLAEKRKKDDFKLKQELSRKKLIDDFEKVLDQPQLMKRVFNRICAENFLFVVDFARTTVANYFDELSSNVSPDLVFFLGVEHFPEAIQDRLNAKMKSHHKDTHPKFLDVGMLRPTSRGSSSRSMLTSDRESGPFGGHASSPPSLSRSESQQIFIGADASPPPKERPEYASILFDYEDFSDMRVESVTKTKLAGNPSVLASLRALVTLGKTFPRFSFRDMVEVLHFIATSKISAYFRGYRKRWRYSVARLKWRRIFRGLRVKYFRAWASIVIQRQILRRYCFRKVVAWFHYTQRMKERREVFRLCFWPFFVWRKFSNASATAREKAKFLTTRVLPTLATIQVFNAWKSYSMKEVRMRQLSTNFLKAMTSNQCHASLLFWKSWAHQRRLIRQAWHRAAKEMRRKILRRLTRSRFFIWRIFVWYRREMRRRVGELFYHFRETLMPRAKVWKKLSYTEKRISRSLKRRSMDQNRVTGSSKRSRKTKKSTSQAESGARKDSVSSQVSQRSQSSRRSSRSRAQENDDASVASTFSVVLFDPSFRWKCDFKAWLDVDSDGEDGEDVPDLLMETYTHSNLAPFPSSIDFLPFLPISTTESWVLQRLASTAEGWRYRELWNLLDAALRFHRYAFLAFKNLRLYALVKSRVKKFCRKRRMRALRVVWLTWKAYTSAGGGPLRSGSAAPSEGEILYYQVRTHMSSKLLRTRKLVEEVSKHYNREAESDDEEEEEKVSRQMRNLNLLSEENDDDYSYIEEEKKRAKERALELKRRKEKAALLYGSFQPPNLLDLDEKDRIRELAMAKNMLKYSANLKVSLNAAAAQAQVQHDDAVARRLLVKQMVQEVLDAESGVTDRAVNKQQEYASKFKEHAAKHLLDVLAKIYEEVQKKLIQEESKIYFRAMRMPLLITRSKKMLARKKLKNYIRLCNRLRSLNEKAPFYHKMRTLWIIFKRWTRFMCTTKLYGTPGFKAIVDRKLLLHPDFHNHLKQRGFLGASYCDDKTLQSALSDFRVLFSRWKTYTQEKVMFRILSDKVIKVFKMKLLRKCLWALRTGLKIQDFRHQTNQEPASFPITRISADIDQLAKRFLPLRKYQLPNAIQKRNRMVIRRIKNLALATETFKSFLNIFIGQISLRINTEQRLLHEAFEARGSQDFVDVAAPRKDDPIVPPIMTKLEGRTFFDPQHPNTVIPAGFRLTRVKWALQNTAAATVGNKDNGSTTSIILLGWQLYWSADGTAEIESPPRGQWHNAGFSIQETVIPKEDFVIGVEYLYDGPTIVGIRLKLFHGGYTKWIGGKTSLSTLSVLLSADNEAISPKLPFEENRLLDRDEEALPALPYRMVIGFSGLLHNNRTTNIGLIVRKIHKQNIFSYFWIQDVLEREAAKPSSSDHQSSLDHSSGLPGDESLTLDSSTSQLDNNGQVVAGESSNEHEIGEEIGEEDQEGEDVEDEEQEEEEEEEDGDEAKSHRDGEEGSKDGKDGASDRDKTAQRSEASPSASERRNQRMLIPRIARKFARWMEQDEMVAETLTSSEKQFFDILRMRMTELSSAKTRADEFARRVWTSRDVRSHPTLAKLVNLRIVAQLTRWFFNAISRRLIPFCSTEKSGLYLFKLSRKMESKAKIFQRRARNNLLQAHNLETSRHSWDGKPVLGPQERTAKRQLFLQVAELRANASKLEKEAEQIMTQAKENEEKGLLLLPRISLNSTVYSNFKTKIAAARHKESLLERMSLDQIKNGLFGSNMKETLLNKDQMQAIHASLRERVVAAKDSTSLQRLLDDVLVTERILADKDKQEKRKQQIRHKVDQSTKLGHSTFQARHKGIDLATAKRAMSSSEDLSALSKAKASAPSQGRVRKRVQPGDNAVNFMPTLSYNR
eukprot:gene7135-7888_t